MLGSGQLGGGGTDGCSTGVTGTGGSGPGAGTGPGGGGTSGAGTGGGVGTGGRGTGQLGGGAGQHCYGQGSVGRQLKLSLMSTSQLPPVRALHYTPPLLKSVNAKVKGN